MKIVGGVMAAVFILIVIFTAGAVLYVKFMLHNLENHTLEYLTNKRSYGEDDILSIDGTVGKLPLYQIRVIFKDEPNNVYIYREMNNRIIQIYPDESYDNHIFKHKE